MLQSLVHDANWVKLNEAELAILCLEVPGLKHALLAFCTQFGLEMLGVTFGAKGAVACDRQQHFVTVQSPTNNRVVDRVGVAQPLPIERFIAHSANNRAIKNNLFTTKSTKK